MWRVRRRSRPLPFPLVVWGCGGSSWRCGCARAWLSVWLCLCFCLLVGCCPVAATRWHFCLAGGARCWRSWGPSSLSWVPRAAGLRRRVRAGPARRGRARGMSGRRALGRARCLGSRGCRGLLAFLFGGVRAGGARAGPRRGVGGRRGPASARRVVAVGRGWAGRVLCSNTSRGGFMKRPVGAHPLDGPSTFPRPLDPATPRPGTVAESASATGYIYIY
jgi:hypothetical protein